MRSGALLPARRRARGVRAGAAVTAEAPEDLALPRRSSRARSPGRSGATGWHDDPVSPKPLAPWDELHRRAEALPPDRRAAFALACAEHLVSITASPRQAELRVALARGWAVLDGGSDDLTPLRAQLEGREDVDEDDVAGVYYALGAVQGSADDAWWAARRASDAAYERVPYPNGASTSGRSRPTPRRWRWSTSSPGSARRSRRSRATSRCRRSSPGCGRSGRPHPSVCQGRGSSRSSE